MVVVRSPPRYSSKEEELKYRKWNLAAGFRVFAKQRPDEGVSGHISLPEDEATENFWINPLSAHFAQVRVSDLVLVNQKGEMHSGCARATINTPALNVILQNHDMITCGRTADEAAFLFIALGRCCYGQMLANGTAFPASKRDTSTTRRPSLHTRRTATRVRCGLNSSPTALWAVQEDPKVLD
ncbi:arad-like aldolase/epimerase [Hypoxylon sp. FL1150]|nr:arad-like aldolase/epimerase [Hypoxylon sp. FL1150]